MDSIDQVGANKDALFDGLQVQPHPTFGYRSEMQDYVLKADLTAAEAKCLANTQFGAGGLGQVFINGSNKLIEKGILVPVDIIKLK